MSDEELMKVQGGSISAALVTSIVNAGKSIFEFGRTIGSAIRRLFESSICKLS